jgi:hypothetical protein
MDCNCSVDFVLVLFVVFAVSVVQCVFVCALVDDCAGCAELCSRSKQESSYVP